MGISEKEIDTYFERIISYLKSEDSFSLRDLSNKLIEKAVLLEDSRLVDMSLICYALSKLMKKPHVSKLKRWGELKQKLLKDLSEVKKEPETIKETDKILKIVVEDIVEFDKEAGNYLETVIDHARVKQASRAYALGLSLSKAASLTGVNKARLSRYVGTTKIHDRHYVKTKSAEERYKTVKKIFGE